MTWSRSHSKKKMTELEIETKFLVPWSIQCSFHDTILFMAHRVKTTQQSRYLHILPFPLFLPSFIICLSLYHPFPPLHRNQKYKLLYLREKWYFSRIAIQHTHKISSEHTCGCSGQETWNDSQVQRELTHLSFCSRSHDNGTSGDQHPSLCLQHCQQCVPTLGFWGTISSLSLFLLRSLPWSRLTHAYVHKQLWYFLFSPSLPFLSLPFHSLSSLLFFLFPLFLLLFLP